MYLPVGPGQDKGARVELMYLPVDPGQDKGARVECTYLLVQDKTKEPVLN